MLHLFSYAKELLLHLCVIAVIFIVLRVFLAVIKIIYQQRKVEKVDSELYSFLYETEELPADDFIDFRTRKNGRSYLSNQYNIPGIYILKNHTRDMHYIGQGKKVLSRVNTHLKGRGSGDVYADYKYGDMFTVQIVLLESTDYPDLNKLEREYIRLFDSYNRGYNKTRGNK